MRVLCCIQSPASVCLSPWAGCPVTLKNTISARGRAKHFKTNSAITSATRVVALKMVFLLHCALQFKYAFWTQYLCLQAVAASFTGIWVCLSKENRFHVSRYLQTFCASCFLHLICSYSCVHLVNYKWKTALSYLLTTRRGVSVICRKSRCVR